MAEPQHDDTFKCITVFKIQHLQDLFVDRLPTPQMLFSAVVELPKIGLLREYFKHAATFIKNK